MLNILCPDIYWPNIKCVGFDLDGTLYDEADFVHQAYAGIASLFSRKVKQPVEQVHLRLFSRWLEKGSSYPFIYDEYLQLFSLSDDEKRQLIQDAVQLYRATEPHLELPQSSQQLLNTVCEKLPAFVVTDGQLNTQRKKVTALNLQHWISEENIIYTADPLITAAKPAVTCLQHLPLLHDIEPWQVVYVGDRKVDRDFARAAGFQFCLHRINPYRSYE